MTINQDTTYPGVSERIRASIADSLVLLIIFFSIGYLFDYLGNIGETPRIVAFVLAIVLYEPILVSFFSATIGHKLVGIKVKKRTSPTKKIIFPLAILRFIIKVLLGWISLITVGFNEQRLAIHDKASGSIVLFKKNKE